jgi:hypothetical protein
MIGPFELWTTARSGDRAGGAGAAGAGPLAASGVFCEEHPVSIAAADAARTVCPNARRLRATGASFSRGADVDPHDPHPVGLHVPHAVPELPITLSVFSIFTYSFSSSLFVGLWRVLISGLRRERVTGRTPSGTESLCVMASHLGWHVNVASRSTGCWRIQCTNRRVDKRTGKTCSDRVGRSK